VEKPNVDWCEKHISTVNPAFSFIHQDVYNGMYNPKGGYKTSEYSFPFEDGSFDLIFLTSVFTHLVPEDTLNYLREISRLLKPGGTCFCTWFLLGHDVGVKYMGPHSKEARVGYGFRHCLEMLEEAGMTFVQAPMLGRWHGELSPSQDQNIGNQDLLLLGCGSDGQVSLLSRYKAPDLPGGDPSELEEVEGNIQLFDPVSSNLTIQEGEETKTFGLPAEAELRMNGQSTDSALLRTGQKATVWFVHEGQTTTGVARAVHTTDRPRMQRVFGTIEAIDREHGLITLIVANNVRTFQFDPRSVRVHSGGEQMGAEELRVGQGISIQQVPDVKDINLLRRGDQSG
jgi:SAM-dependent methyltransferase